MTEQSSKDLWERAFRDAIDPVLVENLDGIVVDLNRAAERTYRFSREELLGKPIKTIVPEDRHSQADDLLRRCLSGEQVADVEGLRQTKEGEVLEVLLSLSLVKKSDGSPWRVITFAKNISALRSAQAELRRMNEELESRVVERTKELAGLAQRLEFELRVAKELAREADQESELILSGDSIAVRALREAVETYGPQGAPLLLRGPRGCGEEAIARAMHRASGRPGAFIYVDCASLARGETTGLFRAAGQDDTPKVELAREGTLYLQGVDALDPAGQLRLGEHLRSAEDIRVVAHTAVAATDPNGWPTALREIPWRELNVPRLAERRDDIRTLATRLAELRAHGLGRIGRSFNEEALRRLENYAWPGNLRELYNVVEQAVLHGEGESLDVRPEQLAGGQRIGGYHLVEKLGEGGMGEVWLGEHDLLARPAAIKLISTAGAESTEPRDAMLTRFRREAKATARLRSPHTVELYDFGVTETGTMYYVMEHLVGMDLDTLVRKFGAQPPARVAHLLLGACSSLEEAHQLELIHRDIKPSNLFTAVLGVDFDVVKVLDFGIVKQVGAEKTKTMTAAGAFPGTPGYLAPEILLEQGGASPASDLYALGCAAYYVLTGSPVFQAENVLSVAMMHGTQRPMRPSKRRDDVPAELDEIVLACLEKAPEDRPRDAEAVRRALESSHLADAWTQDAARTWWSDNVPELASLERLKAASGDGDELITAATAIAPTGEG